MYTGKEKCQGCGKSGNEKARGTKDHLCQDCKNLIALGKTQIFESNIKYVLLFQNYHAYNDQLNNHVHALLESLNNPDAKPEKQVDPLLYSWGSNGKYYTIDTRFFKPLQQLFGELNQILNNVKKDLQSIPDKVRTETQKYKNEIYNQGVTKGRNLLIQLNNEEISANDFTKDQVYH